MDKGKWPVRCVDCFVPGDACPRCAVLAHQENPFHRVMKWDPKEEVWSKQSLADDGMELYLGHGGLSCPVPDKVATDVHIVHEHGIHTFPVLFCCCIDGPSTNRQLIDFGLWPGSWKKHRTAFTFNTMRTFHLLSLQSQMSAYDYIQYLARSTDAVAPHDITVCAQHPHNPIVY